jgi:hypothetical protein
VLLEQLVEPLVSDRGMGMAGPENGMVVSGVSRLWQLAGPRGILGAAFLVVAAWTAPPATAQQTGAVCSSRPAIVSRLPRSAVLDTIWCRWDDGLRGCRVVNRRNAWAIDDSWFTIGGHPERFYRLSELLDLSRGGVINDSTRVLWVHYRFVVKAATDSAARTAAMGKLSSRPPKQVRKELRRLEREYQAKLRAANP